MAGINIRQLKVDTPLALAPMVGLTHSAGRSLLRELGGVGLLFTEMLSATRLPYDNPESSPMLVRTSEEKPLIYQIFIASEESVERAVARIEELGADGIDINLGCPAPQVRKRGAGGFLAENRELVSNIIRKIRKNTELPVSAKIRLGQELNKDRYLDFCKMLEYEGVDLLTVHARLHKEKFCRPARWEWVAMAKNNLHIPVLANGGIFSVNDARACLDITGADGLMLGRGAFENPYLFADIACAVYGSEHFHELPDRDRLYMRFIEMLEQRFRPERRLGRLKQFSSYFAAQFQFGHRFASSIQNSRTMEEAKERAEMFFSHLRREELAAPHTGTADTHSQ